MDRYGKRACQKPAGNRTAAVGSREQAGGTGWIRRVRNQRRSRTGRSFQNAYLPLLRIPERLDRRLYPAIRFLDQRPPGATGARTTGGFYQGAVPAANRRATEQLYPAAPLPLGTIDRQRTGGRVA